LRVDALLGILLTKRYQKDQLNTRRLPIFRILYSNKFSLFPGVRDPCNNYDTCTSRGWLFR